MVSHDLGAHLDQRLSNDRVYLPRHDARTGLDLRKQDFEQPCPWSGTEPPKVVCDLHEAHRNRVQDAARRNRRIHGRLSLEMVGGFVNSHPRRLGQPGARLRRKFRMRIDARANRGPAKCYFTQFGPCVG